MEKSTVSVLIVEDNPINAAQLLNIVASFTDDITLSTSAERGFLIFNQALHGQNPYQILITDINLPGMSGKELCRDIRSLEDINKIKSQIRIIAVSAGSPSEHLLDTCSAGAGCYLEKPITKEKLLEAVKKTGLIK